MWHQWRTPSTPLPNFAAFKKCKPDADGLYEVYFEYDDELEYQARALRMSRDHDVCRHDRVRVPDRCIGAVRRTGRVRGERMVTDPRQQVSRDRLEFWELANFVRQRFGEEHWDCKDLPADDGETPAGSRFIKSHCEKTVSGMHLILEQRLLQKKGSSLSIQYRAGRNRRRSRVRPVSKCMMGACRNAELAAPYCPMVPSTRSAPFVFMPVVTAPSRSALLVENYENPHR